MAGQMVNGQALYTCRATNNRQGEIGEGGGHTHGERTGTRAGGENGESTESGELHSEDVRELKTTEEKLKYFS